MYVYIHRHIGPCYKHVRMDMWYIHAYIHAHICINNRWSTVVVGLVTYDTSVAIILVVVCIVVGIVVGIAVVGIAVVARIAYMLHT
jgi:hypothetical protein